MNLLKEGNVRALKFGCYIASVIIALFIYNFFIKLYFDPCCEENTFGEFMFSISNFLSYILGAGIIATVILVFIKIGIDKFKPEREIFFRKKKESFLNKFFIVILLANFCLLLAAQLPKLLIGCFGCKINHNSERFLDHSLK
ncbi:MAG: hypothetical protein GWO87_00870 [Xanthomonadaceae bacterium]|nr:hypothetical protein [Rhodospirillaceae bacterium]NIA17726.1 hypothetical protein [Xanthomonadaceae bacterium]